MPSCKACVGTHSAVLQIHPPVKIVPRLPHSRASRSAFNGEAERQRFIAFDQRRADRSSDQRQVGYIKKPLPASCRLGGRERCPALAALAMTLTTTSSFGWLSGALRPHKILTETPHYTCCGISGSYTDTSIHLL